MSALNSTDLLFGGEENDTDTTDLVYTETFIVSNGTFSNSSTTNYTNSNTKTNDADSVYAISNAVSIVFIIIVILVIFFWRRYQRNKKKLKKLTKEEVSKFLEGDTPCGDLPGYDPAVNIAFSVPYNKNFEINLKDVEIDRTNLLGSGAYGMVYKGILNLNQPINQPVNESTNESTNEPINQQVAIKTLKPNADILYFKSLLSELKVLIYIGSHENIVKLIGSSTAELNSRKLYIIFEFCAFGSLESYLRDHRQDFKQFIPKRLTEYQNLKIEIEAAADADEEDCKPKKSVYSKYVNVSRNGEPVGKLTVIDLIRYGYEISNAMEYLSTKKVVHGDLATRNVLLNEHRKIKVTDFGLSRQMINYSNYVKTQSKQNPLPWRWLAIETMKEMTFSTKSDVWAFGVTLWEIFSLAQVPYPGLAYSQDFLKMLEKGLRMNSPSDFTPPEIYKIMIETWHEIPDERPSFLELKKRLMDLGL